MTILCITTEGLPGIRPCAHLGQHPSWSGPEVARDEKVNSMNETHGAPIPDPDPTGDYPNGWHPAEEWEYRAVGSEGEPVSGTHSLYESAFGEAEERGLFVAGFERRSMWRAFDPQARVVTGREARGDERETLNLFRDLGYDETSSEVIEARSDEREREAVAALVEDAFRASWDDGKEYEDAPRDIADALWSAGYRKHPEPEITEDAVVAAYHVFTDNGSSPEAMRLAIEAALRVPVGEGEQS